MRQIRCTNDGCILDGSESAVKNQSQEKEEMAGATGGLSPEPSSYYLPLRGSADSTVKRRRRRSAKTVKKKGKTVRHQRRKTQTRRRRPSRKSGQVGGGRKRKCANKRKR